MKTLMMIFALTLSISSFAASEGHATGGIASNNSEILARKEFNTAKINLNVAAIETAPTKTPEMVKQPVNPEYTTASANGMILSNF
jgi:hypothetical protein